MLQIEEWFRRPQRKNEEDTKDETAFQDAPVKTDAQEHVSDGNDAEAALADAEKEDVLLQQIDEFREKAMQLQQLMQSRELQARELQGMVEQQEAQTMDARNQEADKLMDQVTQRIDEISMGVRTEMSGLSDAVSKEVGGLTQNLTHELNQSTEKTRLAVEAAAQNMIDQNARSMKGLQEQIDQLNHLEQLGDLSNEMNSQITTLKTDIVDRIHAEDVKCYRNIQASLDEQSKQFTEADEGTRQYISEQMGVLHGQLDEQAKLMKLLVLLAGINVLGSLAVFIFLLLT